jgi:tetratricopeptide (TPR) repeat protein
LIDPFCAKDPANRAWQKLALTKRLREAEFVLAEGNPAEAVRLAADVSAGIEKLVQADPSVREFAVMQMQCGRLEAVLRAARNLPEAASLATKAVELGEKILAADSSNHGNARNGFLQTCVSAAAIHRGVGDSATAEALLRRVVSLAGPQLERSRDWRLLDPVARALAGLGRTEQARGIAERLAKSGYRPLFPWPEGLQP